MWVVLLWGQARSHHQRREFSALKRTRHTVNSRFDECVTIEDGAIAASLSDISLGYWTTVQLYESVKI